MPGTRQVRLPILVLAPLITATGALAQQAAPVPPAVLVGAAVERAEALIGKPVVGAGGQTLGEVSDVILTAAGRPEQIVVRCAGPAGPEAREVAVDFARVESGDEAVRIAGASPADMAAMPEFSWDDTMTSLSRGGSPADTAVPVAPAPDR